MIGSTLNRRLAKLESLAAIRQVEPDCSEEERARIQRIIDRLYAKPERYAECIAIMEQVKATPE